MMVFVVLAILSVLFFSIKSNASETVSYNGPEIGYQVVVSIGKFHSNKKVMDFQIAQNMVSNHFQEPVNLKNLMFNSHHVNIDSGRIRIYVERKIVVRKRRIRFRKIRKRDNLFK
jgi:hypothetical protein